jgi:uncharacterized protein YPO0396
MNAVATDVPADGSEPCSTLILCELEVYNWGPFEGLHRAEMDERGTAIIGPTGSGKTTLVDALMTLITAQPKYNLASTGGHESDRDLISYIRGVSGTGNNSGDNSHVARAEKTVTGLSARFASAGQSVIIGAVLWMDGTSSAPSDLKRLWIFSRRGDQSLENWLETHHEGGARALNQFGRETQGLQVFPSKKAYLAELRRFFEVGENAFTLLNRAAGLKQLNSIDEIFRELVLDDHSAFERAAEVAGEFDDLATIHAELETARRQQHSLLPIERSNRDYLSCQTQLAEQQELLTILPSYYATIGYRLWTEQEANLGGQVKELEQQIQDCKGQENSIQGQADALREIYLRVGGAGIEQLKERIAEQSSLIEERRSFAADYQNLTKSLGLDETLSAEALRANQQLVGERRARLEFEKREQEEARLQLGAALVAKQNRVRELKEELEKIRSRPGSNIEGGHQDFRSDLAGELGLSEEQLPFVAELVEVQPEEIGWRGAIERAIGSHRLRILVPSSVLRPALAWVNRRDNRLHVRLLEASEPNGISQFMEDGFTRKLNFRKHPYRETVKALLASLDRHCVDSPERLRDTPHGMTVQGLMSGKSGYFDKHDQSPLDKGWMTGFDNRDRLANLATELNDVTAEEKQCGRDHDRAKQQEDGVKGQINLLESLSGLKFTTIDLPGALASLAALEKQLEMLTDPDSAVAKARMEYERAAEVLAETRTKIAELNGDLGGLEERRRSAAQQRSKAFDRIGGGLTEEQGRLSEVHLADPGADALGQLDQVERTERQRIEGLLGDLGEKVRKLQQQLVRQMGMAKSLDTGALSEAGTELHDIPHYVERLRILNEEALPEKRNRFLSYLNQSSDQGVTQLLAGIENEVSIIEERISDLNQTLRRVDFQPGRYLRLEPRQVVHESLRTLQNAQRHLRSAALKDDEGESHYKALAEVVKLLGDAADNKRTVGARALLDPRYRLQFSVAVLDRGTGETIEIRTGSQGGSGGEKEIIASYILTASLSYALCPEGRTRPLFGTIVLDEAFSKSSQAVAGRIISALREFGLHPLFVTPNKEMRLLRSHTRSAILVHRKAMRATLTSLSWEELEAHAQNALRA